MMRTRCTNPNVPNYKDYGGRGIAVCERWRSFEAFLADMGPRPGLGYSIERINNDGDYEPGNCRWADRAQQSNNRRNNRLLTWNGETKTLAEWSRTTGLDYAALLARLNRGWSVERALSTPMKT
jgi:hypothetical protein